MNKDKLLHQLKEHFWDNPSIFSRQLKKKPELYEFVDSQFDDTLSTSEKLYLLVNDMKEPPACEICDKKGPHYFLGSVKGYSRTCSKSCAHFLRAKENGGLSPTETASAREKMAKTKLERYGDPTFNNSEKTKKTLFDKHGVTNARQVKEVNNKAKETFLKRYGVKNPAQSEEIQQKARKTTKERYGVWNLSQNPEIKNKMMESNKQFDEANPGERYEKAKATNKERYGTEFWTRSHWDERFIEIMESKELLEKELELKTPVELANEWGVTWSVIYNQANRLGLREKYVNFSTEDIVENLLFSFGVTYLKNNREVIKPKELDFWVPEHNIAIEVCGLYWHSEARQPDKMYHRRKYEECENKGIQLITIFEDELKNVSALENRLEHKLGKADKTCGARDLIIRELMPTEAREFVNRYHTQGYVESKIKYGGFYKDELVAVMTFGKNRKAMGKQHVEGEYELLRFCTKGNIPGAGDRLFKRFVTEYTPSVVTSFADLRWGAGDFYKNLGFNYISDTKPNYYYTDKKNWRKHRYQFRKSVLLEKLGYGKHACDKTERELAKEYGIYRIWDCGHAKWVWEK